MTQIIKKKKFGIKNFVLAVFVFLFQIQFFGISESSKAEFLYDPVYLIVDAPRGRGVGSVTITNPMDKPLRVQLNTSLWELDENSQVVNLEEKEDSITKYIKISPRQFTLPAGQKRKVRVACALPSNLEKNKEYQVFLNILEIGADRKSLESKEKFAFGLVINKRMSAGTYIRYGEKEALDYEIDIKDVSISDREVKYEKLDPITKVKSEEAYKQIQYQLSYSNKGNLHGRMNLGYRIFDQGNKLVFEDNKLGLVVAMPTNGKPRNYKSSFIFPKELEEQTYKIQFLMIDFDSPSGGKRLIESEKLDLNLSKT